MCVSFLAAEMVGLWRLAYQENQPRMHHTLVGIRRSVNNLESCLPIRFIPVHNELGIGVASQFVQIHPEPLAISIDT